MNSSKNRKIILITLLVCVCALFLSGFFNQVQADELPNVKLTPEQVKMRVNPNIPAEEETQKEISGLVYIAARIAAWVFMLSAWILEYVINLSSLDKIKDLDAVELGWQIIRDIANLGFVLAIIVIAFATILRRETYAIKQTIGKLIVAALLVNFSLVIAGAFISVSDVASDVFLSKIGSIQGQNFALKIAAVINPQRLLETQDAAWYETALNLGKALLSFIISLAFVTVFTGLMIISFLTLALMMAIRYVALAILLILSPIVWLMWIFPATKGLWDSWWKQFIRWTFFAPIVLFFVYLTIMALPPTKCVKTDEKTGKCTEYTATIASDAAGLVAPELTNVLNKNSKDIVISQSGLTDMVANGLILLGLLFGGLLAANKMSITGASLGIGLAKGAGKKFGAWSGRMALRGAAYPLTKPYKKKGEEEAKSLAQRFQESKLAKIGGPFNPLAWASRGVTGLAAYGSSREVARYEKMHAGESAAEWRAAMNTAMGPERVALIKLLSQAKAGQISDVSPSEKKRFERYDQASKFKEVEAGVGGSHEVFEAEKKAAPFIKDVEKLEKKAEESDKIEDRVAYAIASEKLEKNPVVQEAQQKRSEWFSNLSDEEQRKLPHSKIFGSKAAFGLDQDTHNARMGFHLNTLMSQRPDMLGAVARAVPGNNLFQFTEAISKQFGKVARAIQEQAIGRGITDVKGLRITEAKELETLQEILKQKAPDLHFQMARARKSVNNVAQYSVGGWGWRGEFTESPKKEKTT